MWSFPQKMNQIVTHKTDCVLLQIPNEGGIDFIYQGIPASFSTTNNTMKKIIPFGASVYEAPACDVICIASESAILQASTDSFSINKWSEDPLDDDLTF